MSLESSPAGYPSLREIPLEATAHYLSEQTRNYLAKGLGSLDKERVFCDDCPMALLCAATESEVSSHTGTDLRPGTSRTRQQNALRTLSAMGIRSIDAGTSLCLSAVIDAAGNESFTEASVVPTQADPLPHQSPLWLIDRVRVYTDDVIARLQRGERI